MPSPWTGGQRQSVVMTYALAHFDNPSIIIDDMEALQHASMLLDH